MFTGIVTDKGRVSLLEHRGDTRIVIETVYPAESLTLGASIACNGACLTVVEAGALDTPTPLGHISWFAIDASAETLSCTSLGDWSVGTRVNLERSLRVGEELGGHIVSGHVDGVATVTRIEPEGDSKRFFFQTPSPLLPYIASKGSVALDGVSLTVNEVENDGFGVNIIPHTQEVTTFGGLKPGSKVNLEVDLLARYVARLAEAHRS